MRKKIEEIKKSKHLTEKEKQEMIENIKNRQNFFKKITKD